MRPCYLAAVLLAAVAAACADGAAAPTPWCHYDRRSGRLRDKPAGRCGGNATGCFQFALMTVRLAAAGDDSLRRTLLNHVDQSPPLRLPGHGGGSAAVDAPYCWQGELAAAFRAQCFEHIADGKCGMTTLQHDDDTPVYLCCCTGDRCNAAAVDDSFYANYRSGARYGTGDYFDARCLGAITVPLHEFDDDEPDERAAKAAQERLADGDDSAGYSGYYIATVCLASALALVTVGGAALAAAGLLYWRRSRAPVDASSPPQPQSPADTTGSSVRSSAAAGTPTPPTRGDIERPPVGWRAK